MISNNPFSALVTDSVESDPADRPVSKPFAFRPSSLQSHASTLLKDVTLQKPSLTGFKLEPPKLFSPFPGKKVEDSPNSENASIENKNNFKLVKTNDVPKFIFGEKLEQRVTNIPEANFKESKNNGTNGEVDSSSLSFKNNFDEQTAKPIVAGHSSDEDISSTTTIAPEGSQSSQRTLAESVAEQLAKEEENRLDLKEVEVVTGEENELNVFKFSAKLYMFEKEKQSWMERGFGTLRLNDRCLAGTKEIFQSRLVMRTHGCLRVILNTMLWPQMLIERASGKMVKISVHDPEDASIKIYILSLNPSEADQVFAALTSRVQQLKLQLPSQSDQTTSKKRSNDEANPTDIYISPVKKSKLDTDKVDTTGEESNDSNTQYPETEASNEGFTSSPNVQSSSSSEA